LNGRNQIGTALGLPGDAPPAFGRVEDIDPDLVAEFSISRSLDGGRGAFDEGLWLNGSPGYPSYPTTHDPPTLCVSQLA
jgi:hypothetical protein